MIRGRKKILVLSVTAGAGHLRAADAIIETSRRLELPFSLKHMDILDYTSPIFKKLYNDLYFTLVSSAPEIWGYLYKHTHAKTVFEKKSPLVKLFDHINYSKYLKMIEKENPDAILCTHFLPYVAISDYLISQSVKFPFSVVTTDHDVHPVWVHPSIKRYYVASEESAFTIESYGIPKSKIKVTGIPVMPQFTVERKRKKSAKKIGVSDSVFTILILSGGYGIGFIDQLVSSLISHLPPRRRFQLLVACGRNKKLYSRLTRLEPAGNISLKLFEFVDFIDVLMDCSDILITKSGGLTISEALAKHLPMVIYQPIPGQEIRNAQYLIEHGAALFAHDLVNLNFKINRIIERPSVHKKMILSSARLAKPDAAEDILRDLYLMPAS